MPSCILIKFLRQLLYSKYPPFDSISTVLSKIGLKESIEKHFLLIWDKPEFRTNRFLPGFHFFRGVGTTVLSVVRFFEGTWVRWAGIYNGTSVLSKYSTLK